MRRAWLAALAGPVLMGAGPAPVTYTLTPELRDGRLERLAVELRLPGDADGVTELRLPDRWAGETELHRHLSDFAVTGAAWTRPSPDRLRLTHRPGAALSVRYRVANGRGGGAGVDYRPDLEPDGFTVLGETVFAWPVGRLSWPASARLADTPEGWSAATDLTRADTVDAVRESVTTAGRAVRLATRNVGSDQLTVALRGRFAFTAEAAADLMARVLAAQRAAHGEPAGPFLAVIQGLPEDPGRFIRDGMGRGDAAAFFVSSEEPLTLMARVLAHEPVHAWLPRKVGGLPQGAQEPAGYWFSEGFSDFVALRSLVRAHVGTLEEYASGLNSRADIDVMGPPVPNSEIVAGYGRRRELFQLPYRRGMALALLWDSRLREATGGRVGVDDVLAAMRVRAAGSRPAPTADVLFPRVYRQLGGPDLSADTAAYVQAGRPIVWPDTLYDGCLVLRSEPSWRLNEDLREVPSGDRLWVSLRSGLTAAEAERCRRLLIGAGA